MSAVDVTVPFYPAVAVNSNQARKVGNSFQFPNMVMNLELPGRSYARAMTRDNRVLIFKTTIV